MAPGDSRPAPGQTVFCSGREQRQAGSGSMEVLERLLRTERTDRTGEKIRS